MSTVEQHKPIATWPRLLGVIVWTVVLAVGVASVSVALWPHDPDRQPGQFGGALFTGSAVGELVALGLLVWLLRRGGVGLRDLGWRRATTWKAIGVGIAVALVYSALTIAALPAVAQYSLAPTALKLLSIVTTVLIVGIIEEVIFRGYVMTALSSMGHGRVLQVAVSSVAFGLAHFSGPATMVFTLGLGVGLGVVYLLGNRSLTPVIIAHMLVNLIIEPGLYLSIPQ